MTVGLFGPQVMSLLMQVEEENKGETVESKTKMESWPVSDRVSEYAGLKLH